MQRYPKTNPMEKLLVQQTLRDNNQPSFRADQIKDATMRQLASDWDDVKTLPAALREDLKKKVPFNTLELVSQSSSSKGDTIKAAFKLQSGEIIETVLMVHQDGRNTVCVSSQAGCAMACTFCATGELGFKRNLTEGEIVDQVLYFARALKAKGQRVTNMVLMGMGEPLHNLDNVFPALETLNDDKGLNLGARRMSISTCGIVAGIERITKFDMQVNLAISLHSPTDELRERLMPINKPYPIAKLMESVEKYVEKTNRKVMFEYLLIKDINDTPEVAHDLADLLQHPLYHVNLIKYHTTGSYVTSPFARRDDFMKVLRDRGVSVTHRISFGEDIDAACGQLANKESAKALNI